MKQQIVTIDGPAGAGKTTVAKALSSRLDCVYVDTGALYRAVAYEISSQKIDWRDDHKLSEFLLTLDLEFVRQGDDLILLSHKKDISGFIRTPEISMLASDTSALPQVRAALLGIQRSIAQKSDAVFEGRDMGTVVFPEAAYKFFLFADLKIRAKRRFDEMVPDDKKDMENVLSQMETRDQNDSNRAEAPLKPARDAVKVDSTHMNVEQVIDYMLKVMNKA